MKYYEKVTSTVSAMFLSNIIRVNELADFFGELPFRVDYDDGVLELSWNPGNDIDRKEEYFMETNIDGTKWLVKDATGISAMPDNVFKQLYKEAKEPAVIAPKPKRNIRRKK